MVGVSFKISKTGTRYRPKPASFKPASGNVDGLSLQENSEAEAPLQTEAGSKRKRREAALVKISGDLVACSLPLTSSEVCPIISEQEVSFAVNLFLDGFSIGKPTEIGKSPPSAQGLRELLHPYDRASETFFQAIDGGWLPGDILEDIPCKYIDGSVVCEVRDYRKNPPLSGDSSSFGEGFPVVRKVLLRPTTESIVKDISFMAQECWAYSDLMEIEARILNAVKPDLCLDPTPMLERLCESPSSNKLNLGVPMTRRQRMQMGGLASVTVMCNNVSHGKKVSIEGSTEKATSQSTNSVITDTSAACVQESPIPALSVVSRSMPLMRSKLQISVESGQDMNRYGVLGASQSSPVQTGRTCSRFLNAQENQLPMSSSSTTLMSCASNSIQDGTNNFVDARSGGVSLIGKRDIRNATTTKVDMKKPKQEQTYLDKFQQQSLWSKIDTKQTRDQQRKDSLMQQHQNFEVLHFSDVTIQRHPQQSMKDDDQKIALGEFPQNGLKLSPQLDQRITGELKVKEEWTNFERGHISIEQEKQEAERNKEDHVMELDNNVSDQQQLSCQCFPQQQFGKSHVHSTQQWQNVGQLAEKVCKMDELLQKKKLIQSPNALQKPDVKGLVPSVALPKSGELSQTSTHSAVLGTSVGPTYTNMLAPAAPGPQREKSLGLAAVSTSATSVNLSQIDLYIQPSMSFVRHRSNSLPKTSPLSGGGSPGSVTNLMVPSSVNSPSIGTAPMPSSGPKTDQPIAFQGQNEQLENIASLVSVVQRHGLLVRKKDAEEFPETKKALPSRELVSDSLAGSTDSEDQKDFKGQKSMANSLIGGNINARKTHILNFVRKSHFLQGHSPPVFIHRNWVRLVMCKRAKDEMVDAAVQFGDDQDDDSLNAFPHVVLPTLANTYFADRLAKQFSALMEKEGYELTDDQIQPIVTWESLPLNAASSAHSMVPGASTLCDNITQLPSSSLIMAAQNISSAAALCGTPSLNSLQVSSPNALAAVQMPPPANIPSRQLSAAYLQGGMVTSSKLVQLDPASQLAAVQHQQQQQQHPLQLQQHQPQIQRSHQFVTANQLAQLNATNHNSNPQMNTQMVNGGSHLQQQRQQQQQQFQRKIILPGSMAGLGAMGAGNISGVNSMTSGGMPLSAGAQGGLANMVGLSGMNSMMGMTGISGISASMGGISSLAKIGQLPSIGGMGQSPGIGNMIGQQLQPGPITPAQAAAAFATKTCIAQGRGCPGSVGTPSIRNTIESMSGTPASNQIHNSVGLSMMGQALARGNVSSLQRAAVAVMGSRKVATSGVTGVPGQNFYLNQQLNSQQQQMNSQQQLNHQLNQQQQLNHQLQLSSQHLNMPQPPSSQQLLSSQPSLHVQQQLNQQQHISPQQQLNPQFQMNSQQQLNSQQLSSQQQLNSQHLSVGNLSSLVGGPSSPQLSSQTLGSVGSITSSPVELQSTKRGSSMTTGQ